MDFKQKMSEEGKLVFQEIPVNKKEFQKDWVEYYKERGWKKPIPMDELAFKVTFLLLTFTQYEEPQFLNTFILNFDTKVDYLMRLIGYFQPGKLLSVSIIKSGIYSSFSCIPESLLPTKKKDLDPSEMPTSHKIFDRIKGSCLSSSRGPFRTFNAELLDELKLEDDGYNTYLCLEKGATSNFVRDNVIHISMMVDRELLEYINNHSWTMILKVESIKK